MGEKFVLKSCFITIFCSLLAFGLMNTFASAEPEEQAADYEKWSKIAIDVVKLNYPERKVSDYSYKGREEISDVQAKDTFELNTEGEQGTIKVNVIILFNPKTDSLISLSLEEMR